MAIGATHDGPFHLDDVLAGAILRIVHGPGFPIIRSRDPKKLVVATIVWDVGGGEFDHHDRARKLRPDGGAYSSAGLIWQQYGREALRAIVGYSRPDADIETAWAIIDQGLIKRVDAVDNGEIEPQIDSLASLIDDMNGNWKSSGDEQTAFEEAVSIVGALLRPHIHAAFREVDAERVVLPAVAAAGDPRVIVLDGGTPWHATVHRLDLPVLYAIYPHANGNWMIGCMPSAPRRFDQKRPLPAAWAGLRDADLAMVCGVPDAVFCHLNRFVAAANSLEGAKAMARLALE